MPEDLSLCARCAALGATCCERSQVFLTLGDVERIGRAAPDEDFVAHAAHAGDQADFSADPVWGRTFGHGGVRRIVAHRPDGGCHFLTPSGCRLSLETRPLVCRLYPFEYDASTIKGVNAHLCPGPECGNAPLILALLGMNRDRAEEWRKGLYKEIAEEFPDE